VVTEEVDWAAQWAVKLKVGTDPKSFGEKSGFVLEGKLFEDVFLYRLKEEFRELHFEKTETLQNGLEVIWAEKQIPRQQTLRPTQDIEL
jgi:hypothetical protein